MDKASQGQPGSDVNARFSLGDAASALYFESELANSHFLQNNFTWVPFLDQDINAAFLQPTDLQLVDPTFYQTLFFSLTAGSSSLQTGGILAGFSPGDIFQTSIGASTAPILHSSHTSFGLNATDDIDALNLQIDSIDGSMINNEFSLTAGNSLSASAADILRSTSSLNINGIGSASSIGLLPSDNLNALGRLFIDIPPMPVPVPATVWLFGLSLLSLITIAKKRKA
ncbi:PEP-CTERM sorting domain-containing protein [Colwellia sp. MB02u-6]|uniref:PEP-CTERM sorting domain-containing protein n=1 Tax=Colwellia sp. MB02u-6 TaxID=2759824 RepID=UPI0015F5A45F|nr:PEP-CTERM sorting domain-containing protein [Colwellia sp. MB02u-6]MBA6326764.1 PEP-CTERM sorting domain-containing protein [Colwellia sp. MB02u-6]